MDNAAQQEVFEALRAILVPYADKFVVKLDTNTNYYLDCKNEIKKGYTPMFAAVKIGKNYISYHLMFIYMNPALQAAIGPELKKRMQGKACFNFNKPDPALFEELKALTEKSYQCAKDFDWSAAIAARK